MKVNLDIDISDSTIDRMFKVRCNQAWDCCFCMFGVLPNENYSGCKDKYKKTSFRNDLIRMIDNEINY